MTELLFHAHSGLRYLVFLAAVLALILLVHARVTGRADGGARTAGAIFVGVLDLQVVLGLILLAVWPFYGALIGHIVMMISAVIAAHGARVAARRAATDAARFGWALAAIVVPLVLVIGGIMAIGRPLF